MIPIGTVRNGDPFGMDAKFCPEETMGQQKVAVSKDGVNTPVSAQRVQTGRGGSSPVIADGKQTA